MRQKYEKCEKLEKCKKLASIVVLVLLIVAAVMSVPYVQYRSSLLKHSLKSNATTTRLKDFYPKGVVYVQQDDTKVATIVHNDGEFMAYCESEFPEAFCHNLQWHNWHELVASVVTEESGWAIVEQSESDGDDEAYLMLWNNDGRHGWHCYIIVPDWPSCSAVEFRHEGMSGWIYQDGVRAAACDNQTYSMKPLDVITAYQNGEWCYENSERKRGLLRSHDLGTTVGIAADGSLFYQYSAKHYYAFQDPQSIACGDYDKPWWEQATVEEKAHLIMDKTDYVGTTYYPDLPVDYQDSIGKIYSSSQYWGRGYNAEDEFEWESGTFFLTERGAFQASHGKIINSWEFDSKVTDETCCYISPSMQVWDYVAYVYNGEQILGLKAAAGEFDAILDEVVLPPYRGVMAMAMGITDGNLIAWSSRSWALVAENVTGALCEGPKLFTKEDGCYAVMTDLNGDINYGEFEIVYLGTESMEYYADLYKVLDQSHQYY